MIQTIGVMVGLISMFAAYCCRHVKNPDQETAYLMMRIAACSFLVAIIAHCIAYPKQAIPGLFP